MMYFKEDWDLYTDSFSIDEIDRTIGFAKEHSENDDGTLKDLVNMMLSAVISDVKEDSEDPSHDPLSTKYHYRDYYDEFSNSEYEGLDKDLLRKLEELTKERDRRSRTINVMDFLPYVSYGSFRQAIMYAMIHQDVELANKLTGLVVADTCADIRHSPLKARCFYGRYYKAIKECMIVSDELKKRLCSLLETEFDSLLDDAMEIAFENEGASVLVIKEKLNISHMRAAKIIDQMDLLGFIGPVNESEKREIIVDKEKWNLTYKLTTCHETCSKKGVYSNPGFPEY